MAKLVRTSVQLPTNVLEWLDNWPGMTRSEALRLVLERDQYSRSQMDHVVEVALKYHPILTPALEEFTCANYRAAARALPAMVEGFVRENGEYFSITWRDDDGNQLDARELLATLEKWGAEDRIYLLDCIVARRYWPKEPVVEAERPVTKHRSVSS